MDQKKSVIIIGAGIAGISAAVNLSLKGFRVKMFEAGNHSGGRVFSFRDNYTGDIIDNGQHLLMGAYKNFLNLLDTLGGGGKLLISKGLEVPFLDGIKGQSVLDTTKAHGKLGMLIGLFRMNNFSLRSKIKAITFLLSICYRNQALEDRSVEDILRAGGQDEHIINSFWEPLCLAVMNLKIDTANARIFVAVLKQVFFSDKDSSRLIFSKVGLSELTAPYEDIIMENSGEIFYGKKVERLIFEGEELSSILAGGDEFAADYYISSIPPYRLKKIIDNEYIGRFPYLDMFKYSPIVSGYFWYEVDFVKYRLVSLLDSKLQWIFNRAEIEGEYRKSNHLKGYYALTISGADDIISMTNQEIRDIMIHDLNKHFPVSKGLSPSHGVILKEKFATVRLDKETTKLRPNCRTEFKNFLLAGDWTNTGLPATIEGACSSGFKASEEIIRLSVNQGNYVSKLNKK